MNGDQTGSGVLKSKYSAVEGGSELQSVYTGQFIDGLFLSQMFKQQLVYDRLSYLGYSILDISKVHTMKLNLRNY